MRIPGSTLVRLTQLRNRTTHRLVPASSFATWARSIGLNNDSRIVIVDYRYHGPWLWWAFRRYGHPHVQVLDGGVTAWHQANLPLEAGSSFLKVKRMKGTFQAIASEDFPIADALTVMSSASDSSCSLWDTREVDEWEGRVRVRGAAMAGRIPSAQHLSWTLFRNDSRDQRKFRTTAEIDLVAQRNLINSNSTHIFYCQSGIRTTNAILALYRLGWPAEKLMNYEGSWREWSSLPDLPKCVGSDRCESACR